MHCPHLQYSLASSDLLPSVPCTIFVKPVANEDLLTHPTFMAMMLKGMLRYPVLAIQFVRLWAKLRLWHRNHADLQALGDLLNQGRPAQPSDTQSQADEAPLIPYATSRAVAASRRGSAIMPAATLKAPAVSRRGSTVAAATVDPEMDPEVCVVSEHAYPAS